jgi:hypothetical protein
LIFLRGGSGSSPSAVSGLSKAESVDAALDLVLAALAAGFLRFIGAAVAGDCCSACSSA